VGGDCIVQGSKEPRSSGGLRGGLLHLTHSPKMFTQVRTVAMPPQFVKGKLRLFHNYGGWGLIAVTSVSFLPLSRNQHVRLSVILLYLVKMWMTG